MQPFRELRRDLVLVGGGHAHALALRMLAMRPVAGVRTTLISPASHTPYSGMLPGLVAGHYTFEQTHIDLARLCQWSGVRFLAAEVTGLDPAAQTLTLAGRPPVGYDLLSIDIGSRPELDPVPGARAHAVPVKPVAGLWRRWTALRERLQARAGGRALRVAVVGGGAGGVELAMAIAHRLAGTAVGIDLWCAGPEILAGYNRRSRTAVAAALARQQISLHAGCRVVAVEPGQLLLQSGTRAAFDELFWCTGASAAPWIEQSGLPTDAAGFLAVRDTLQSIGDGRVFGCGDIATQVNHPRPKAGVFAVRQGPVLAHNLRAILLQQPLREHRPQRRFLSLISLGERRAVADKGPFSAGGRWAWRWKDRIDRAFMDRFAALPPLMPAGSSAQLPPDGEAAEDPGRPPQVPCGGCGAKVAADTLGAVLAELGGEYPAHCLQASAADDAAPVPVSGNGPLLQSLDLLRELVADPWLMGRIAASHALSDLHACGVRPGSALAAVTLPFASAPLLRRELKQILAGALQEFSAVGCTLTGGHSMQGTELSVGFVVNGQPISGEGRLLRKRGLAPGDRLLLTGPLGTGTLFAAQMQLRADGRHIAAAIDAMLVSRGPAAELALNHGVRAATDVTGFGLLGHLLEMLGETLGAHLDLAQLPLLPGALTHLATGIVSSMHAANARAGWALERAGPLQEARVQMLFDPQTCGPLLLGVPAGETAQLLAALSGHGYPHAAVIGEVFAREPGAGGWRVTCR